MGLFAGQDGHAFGYAGHAEPVPVQGYVYDEDTKLYYLRSRYYNPEWGRFISADALLGKTRELLSHNLFCYVKNIPTMLLDTDGHEAIIFGAALGGLLGLSGSFGISATFPNSDYPTDGWTLPKPSNIPSQKDILGAASNIVAIETIIIWNQVKEKVQRIFRNKETDTHHIVARTARQAQMARDYFELADINIDDPDNIIELKPSFHHRLHTNYYNYSVNVAVSVGYTFGGRDGIKDVLVTIQAQLNLFNKFMEMI